MPQDIFPPLKTHRLKSLLKEHDVKHSQAAKAVGVSLPYMNLVLNGHCDPSHEVARKMDDLVDKLLGKD